MADTGFDRAWTNARLATLADNGGIGLIEKGAVASRDGRIAFVGAVADLPTGAHEIIDCGGRLLTPGLIDCHTHLVHAGNRSREFAMRLGGAGYEEIARAGGGIISTMTATRAASEEQLVAESLPRLDALIGEGVTTVEIKSGYGLEAGAERRQLSAARRLGELRPVGVVTSFLGAHAVPPEHKADRSAYLRSVIAMLEPLARDGLVDAVDAFCERIAFTAEEVAMVFAEARRLGLPVKLHADQLSNGGGAALASSWGALSADHLEHTDEAGVRAMAAAGVVAVLLPGAYYCMRETKAPPVALFREHGVAMAVATDCNPGTSPLTSLLLAMNMATVLFGLSAEEALAGATREAARALGRLDRIGTLEVGKQCDLAIWDAASPAELVLRLGLGPLHSRVWRGQ